MKVLLVRHSKAVYQPCMERGFVGFGLDMAGLDDEGVKIANEASLNPVFCGSQLIVSSPFTRALQTAAVLSRKLNLDLVVEIDLREHAMDLTQREKTCDERNLLASDYVKCNGIIPLGESRRWEEMAALRERALLVLGKYKHYGKIVAVTHGLLINALRNDIKSIDYCQAIEYEI